MYKENLRQTIKTLYEQGKYKKQIARILNINVKTVRRILNEDENDRLKPRINKIMIDPDLLTKLYKQCNGYLQRVHEILTEEHGISIGYSTLTGLCREIGIGKTDKKRSMQFPDLPGEEMQHDTSIYQILLGGKKTKVVCSGLYFRYSKMRYIKFYPFFTRFWMKGFFHEDEFLF